MLKPFTVSAVIVLACLAIGCSEKSPTVVADPEEMKQYETPADYDPASEQSSN